jgi:hypothetical protein
MQSNHADHLGEVMRRVYDEMTAEGRSLPVPPDTPDDDLDQEFWHRVTAQLTPEERIRYRA